ncbi:MAG: tetratricopeptide repeat protein [Candidatus Thermochlorobacter sp.]
MQQYDDTLKQLVSQSLKESEELAALERQCAEQPEDIQVRYTLAEAFAARSRFAEAACAYRAILELKPDFEPALIGLGIAELQLGNFEQAIAALSKAAALNPHSAEIQFYLGNAFDDAGKNDDAMRAFQNALALQPNFEEAHLALGFLYYRVGNRQGVREQYHRLQSLNSPLAEQLSHLL